MKRTACVIATGMFGNRRCLLKNRDRNYKPEIRLIKEIRDDVEIAYLHDEVTGWCEGINEFGLGIVNSALSVARDEAEKELAKKNKKPTKDGEQMLSALTHKSINGAVKVLMDYNGVKLAGHTFVATPTRVCSLELTSKHDCVKLDLDPQKLYVRTNHGLEHEDAGYQKGDNLLSSLIRRENALKILDRVQDPEEIAPQLKKHYFRIPEFDIVRDANMFTSTQMILDLGKLTLSVYLIPGKQKFLGVDDRLPKGYKSKLNIKIYRYKGDRPILKSACMNTEYSPEYTDNAYRKMVRDFAASGGYHKAIATGNLSPLEVRKILSGIE